MDIKSFYQRYFRKEIHVAWVALLLSVLNLVLYNVPFFQFVVQHTEMGMLSRIIFLTSLVVVMVALNFFVFYLLLKCLRIVGRALIAVLFIINATAVYFIFNYHTILDEGMIGNVFNTRYSEASGFFRWSLWLSIFVFGVLPAVYVCICKLKKGTWKQMGKWCSSALVGCLVLVMLNLNNVLWIGKYDTVLGALLMPWGYVVNTCRLFSHQADENQEEILLPKGHFIDQQKTAVVLVIGESARRADFQLYGYKRPTNPRLKQVNDLHVLMAHSNATYTTEGVRCMLEPKDEGDLYEILPNYIYRCGGDVVWRTSNWGEPPVHIKEYVQKYDLAECCGLKGDLHDEVLFTGLADRIRQSKKNKVFIVIHTSTSHGPDYQLQYPAKFEVFKPVCSRIEDAQKEPEHLRNAYDNTIVYTDNYLRNLIDTLRTLDGWQTAMLYMSDHGESLGENDIYMHGLPLNIAPHEQYEVPLFVWTNGNFGTLKKQEGEVDQFYVFHTVIGWFGLRSEAYDESKDLYSHSN